MAVSLPELEQEYESAGFDALWKRFCTQVIPCKEDYSFRQYGELLLFMAKLSLINNRKREFKSIVNIAAAPDVATAEFSQSGSIDDQTPVSDDSAATDRVVPDSLAELEKRKSTFSSAEPPKFAIDPRNWRNIVFPVGDFEFRLMNFDHDENYDIYSADGRFLGNIRTSSGIFRIKLGDMVIYNKVFSNMHESHFQSEAQRRRYLMLAAEIIDEKISDPM